MQDKSSSESVYGKKPILWCATIGTFTRLYYCLPLQIGGWYNQYAVYLNCQSHSHSHSHCLCNMISYVAADSFLVLKLQKYPQNILFITNLAETWYHFKT